jgi:2-dehydro-3-deoxyglucarate aldolase/4-hydroxy-2-oxoheptanedioate aldolase
MISSNEELEAAMRSTLYPPYGTRGFGPLRAVSYGLDDQREYIKKSRTDLIRCVQIESKEGVDAMEQMVKNPYVDCFIIGPCDLSASAGELFEVNGEATQTMIRKAASIARDNGKSIGIATGWETYEELKRLEDMGINVFFVGSDAQYLINHGKEVLKTLGRI